MTGGRISTPIDHLAFLAHLRSKDFRTLARTTNTYTFREDNIISQKKLLPDGTKESIINSVGKEPKTIAQLAKELALSQPSIHRHISEMMASELLRDPKSGRGSIRQSAITSRISLS